MRIPVIGRNQRESLAWDEAQSERYLDLFMKGDDLTASEKAEIDELVRIADEAKKTGYINPCWLKSLHKTHSR